MDMRTDWTAVPHASLSEKTPKEAGQVKVFFRGHRPSLEAKVPTLQQACLQQARLQQAPVPTPTLQTE